MSNWQISFPDFDSQNQNFRESILTLSNTYMGLRGVEDEIPAGSLPGLYIAGLFDKSECLVPEIVNFPSFLKMEIEVDGEKLTPVQGKLSEYQRTLDMANGSLSRTLNYQTKEGEKICLSSRRFLSFYDKNCGAIALDVSTDWAGKLKIITEFDASEPNREGSYLYDEKVRHFHIKKFNDQFAEDFYAEAELRDSGTKVAFASAMSTSVPATKKRKLFGDRVEETVELDVTKDQTIQITKFFVVQDDREIKSCELRKSTLTKLARMKAKGFNAELSRSSEVLKTLWKTANITITGDDAGDRALRFNIFQLIGLGNEDSANFAIGAKGLSTEHYGGHYFWDTEAYLIPSYLRFNPAVARNLLQFRVNTLSVAKQNAATTDFAGCLWPWQSTADGKEGIRNTILENGVVERRAILDQYHIVSDVAFAAFEYLKYTGDEYYFRSQLSLLVVEGMRFWRSFLEKQNGPDASSYHIKGVMGPDEYHTHVDDNFFTNHLTKIVFQKFFHYFDQANEKTQFDLKSFNQLSDEELHSLRKTGEKIFIPEVKNDVIEQFAGYFNLRDLKLNGKNSKGLPIYPDPKVGKGLPDAERQDTFQADATTTRLIKQADVVLALCQTPELFSEKVFQATMDFYRNYTLHFSSLSPGTYALAEAMAGNTEQAWELFKLAVNMDLEDVKAETETGLHTACHGGAYLAVCEGFAGIRAQKDLLEINPNLPSEWTEITIPLEYQKMKMSIKITQEKIKITPLSPGACKIKVKGKLSQLNAGGKIEFSY